MCLSLWDDSCWRVPAVLFSSGVIMAFGVLGRMLGVAALGAIFLPSVGHAADGVAGSVYAQYCPFSCTRYQDDYGGGFGATFAEAGWVDDWLGGGRFQTVRAEAEFDPLTLTAHLTTRMSGSFGNYNAGARSYSVLSYTYSGPEKWLYLDVELTRLANFSGGQGGYVTAKVEVFDAQAVEAAGDPDQVWPYPWFQGVTSPLPTIAQTSFESVASYGSSGVEDYQGGRLYIHVRDGDSFILRSELRSIEGPDITANLSMRFGSTAGLQVALVPEPAGWGLMLAGLAVVASYTRRRCSQSV